MQARALGILLFGALTGLSACAEDTNGPSDAAGTDLDVSASPDRGTFIPDAGLPDVEGPDDRGTADLGLEPGVLVENEGGTALYHANDGTLLAIRPTPSEFPLPEGGQVTLILDRIYTFVDVPNEARIHVRGPPSSPSEALQSFQIDVPGSPEGKPISIWTGCSNANGAGPHILPMASNCLAADDTGEIWIVTYDGGSGHYIHVDDIPVGNAGAAPRAVPLGPWVPFPAPPPSVSMSELPLGFTGSLTTYALRGDLPVYNLTSGFVLSSSTAGVSSLSTLIPELGLEWRRSFVVELDSAEDYRYWTRRGSVVSLGHPLATTASISASDLLPSATSLELDPESGFVSFGFDETLPASVDRVRITFQEDDSERTWEIWLPPGRSQLQLPTIPAEFLTLLPNPNRVELRVEDRDDVQGWSAVLEGWNGEINFQTSPWDWPSLGDYSNRWFVP